MIGSLTPAAARTRLRLATIILLVAVFILAGVSVIPYPGIHNDEAFFSAGVYDAGRTLSQLSVFKKRIPMMLISYLGALKSWLYTPIFAVWKPSAYSVRLPVLVAGAFTLWLFYRLLVRTSGARAALIGCALLATDATFVLTTVFDWGPVALQHLLVVGGALLLVRFHQTGSRASLGSGFVLFGMALWNKAVSVWMLGGLTAGALAAFPRTVARACTRRNVALAVVALCVGAFPLLRYNAQRRLETLRANVGYSAAGWAGKVHLVRSSLDGSGLFGYLTRDDPGEVPSREPRTTSERFSVWLSELAGAPHHGPMPYVLLASVLLVPVLWFTPARHPALFAAVSMVVAWLHMAITKGAGLAVHHTVLLWPWPHFLVAVTFAEGSRRLKRYGAPVLAALLVWVCGSSLLVTNEYRVQFIRNGGSRSWTDASYALSEELRHQPARLIFVVDWGIVDTLVLLHEGRLPVRWGVDPLRKDSLAETDLREFRDMIGDPDHLFVGHTDEYEEFTGIHARLWAMSEEAGYRKELLRIIPDRHGRPVFELFRFRRLPDGKGAEDEAERSPVGGYDEGAVHLDGHFHAFLAD